MLTTLTFHIQKSTQTRSPWNPTKGDINCQEVQSRLLMNHLCDKYVSLCAYWSSDPAVKAQVTTFKKKERKKKVLTLVISMKAVLFLGAPRGGEEDLLTCVASSCMHKQKTHHIYKVLHSAWAKEASLRCIAKQASSSSPSFPCSLQVQHYLLCLHQSEPPEDTWMHVHFTWFSDAVAFSLGILLPAAAVGFLPLGKGMAHSLTVSS